jgi:hypothetical protein
MSSSRIIYQNWIAELGRDPSLSLQTAGPAHVDSDGPAAEAGMTDRSELIQRKVRAAMAELSEDERELVEQVNFMGRCCSEIAALTGRTEHRLEALHRRALRKLCRRLAPLVKELYGIGLPVVADCPICRSDRRTEIDRLIRQRDPSQTWRPVIKRIREEFSLRISTPQTLIGHEKYH